MTVEGISGISHLTNLIELNLKSCTGIDDAAIQQLKGLTNLTDLNLADCPKISAKGTFSESAPSYTFRNRRDPSLGIVHLIPHTNLKVLNLARISPTPSGIKANAIPQIGKLTNLTSLNLKGAFSKFTLSYNNYPKFSHFDKLFRLAMTTLAFWPI